MSITMTKNNLQIQDANEWKAGFDAGAAGRTSNPAPTLASISGFIEGQAKRAATAKENVIVKEMFAEIEGLRETHPEFFAYFEDVDPDTAPRAELVDLMASSPNDQVKYFLFGQLAARMALAAITGRAVV